jgi:putative FmdB family regulatory protein
MPLYEYSCRQCEHTFETLMFGREAVECPECHGSEVERLLSVPAAGPSREASLPMACNSAGPPCGAPWCQRK